MIESVLDPVSDQAKSFIRRLAALDPFHRPTAQEALCDPWLAINTDTPSHVDLFPTLRQNWSPGAKWHSALTCIRAANISYLAAAAESRSSTQSSGGWNDLNLNPVLKEEEEEDDLGQGDILNLFIKNCHFLGKRWLKRIWMIS